jgi:putative membrane protein
MRGMGFFAVALATTLVVGCNKDNAARNDTAVGTAGRADDSVRGADRDFVKDAATSNMAEIELSRTALDRSAGPDVKKFAQMMVDDHPAAGDKLKAVAAQHNIQVPAELDDKHRDLREKLAAKQGLEFDKEYAEAMVEGHQAFVDKLESRIDRDTLSKFKASWVGKDTAKVEATAIAAEKSDNPTTSALNQWAAETYPVAFAHLEAAKELRDGVKKRSTN